jgi:catechol 2,3-dioxygenase-like lactoylglutathione lyase family enzyme
MLHYRQRGSKLMTRASIGSISPFFIVRDVSATIALYESKLGFETSFRQPEDKPFFAILQRDGAMIFIKSGEAMPQPNATRDPEMRWDAYCYAPDPDALAAEFTGRGAPFSSPLNDTADGLRGFEITDPDGYVLFFGRPRER